jgi:hypothetical protein
LIFEKGKARDELCLLLFANVELISTSCYPSVDKALGEVITNMPYKWDPGKDANGG